jgi:hypothetical protein
MQLHAASQPNVLPQSAGTVTLTSATAARTFIQVQVCLYWHPFAATKYSHSDVALSNQVFDYHSHDGHALALPHGSHGVWRPAVNAGAAMLGGGAMCVAVSHYVGQCGHLQSWSCCRVVSVSGEYLHPGQLRTLPGRFPIVERPSPTYSPLAEANAGCRMHGIACLPDQLICGQSAQSESASNGT